MQLTIKKRQIGTSNKFHYEVFADGVKIGGRRSDRTYVAAAVCVPGSKGYGGAIRTDYYVAGWIGREDLINKNKDVKYGAHVARLVEDAKEYEK